MNIKELKEYIKDIPDSTPIGLLDLTTDDIYAANYPISEETLMMMECVDMDDPSEITGNMLFFTFENSLNENPI